MTPAIVLRQLKWTQVVPKVEELGGLSFQYALGNTNVDQAKVRTTWDKVKKKREKESGKLRVTASSEYKEWRKLRGVPTPILAETPCGDSSSYESVQMIASLTF